MQREAASAAYERLRDTLIERAESWEQDAAEAEHAGNSYKGHDNDAAVDLFRQASRSRARAAEFRSIVREAEQLRLELILMEHAQGLYDAGWER